MTTILTLPENYQAKKDCLKGKIILVTGAGDGIGKTAALSFAQHGATVILLGRNLEKLEATYDEIEEKGYPEPALCSVDLNSSNPAHYKEAFKAIDQGFGKLDGLLHNAGVLGDRSPIESYNPEKWLETMQVNINAPFLLSQALLPLLHKSDNASVLFTSSTVGRVGRAFWGAYAVSKFALEGLMETLADELADVTKVRVNSINPGATRTTMRAVAYPGENPESVTPAEDLMPLYLYLMSDDSLNVNGQKFDCQPKTVN